MKLYKLLYAVGAIALSSGFAACSEDDMFKEDAKQAFIMGSSDKDCLTVTGKSGVVWKSRMSNDTIYIQISPNVDPEEELDSIVPKFYISKGATVSPDPSLPQQFWKEEGVRYTVTSGDGKKTASYVVTHGLTDLLEDGGGFSLGLPQNTNVLFTSLGYPGEQANYNFADSRHYGDLNGYVAYCGHDHIVLMAAQYSDPQFDNPDLKVQDESLSFKVFNASDLSQAGNLNIGSFKLSEIRTITSDWNGVLVALVNTNGTSALYYWTSYSSAPKLVGQLPELMGTATNGSNYLQVAGDIFGQANVTTGAGADADGSHYMIHIENGSITDTQIITTGYASNDCNGFQMISPLKPEPNSSYLVGDGEGGSNTNNTIRVYANTYKGATKVIMPNVLQNIWESWWVGTGASLARGGARRPYVSAMYINGKYYAAIMNGTAWWWHNDIAEIDDLLTRVNNGDGTAGAFSVNCAWSFGGSCDWYYDPEIKEAYWVHYVDRYGMSTVRLTCYE